MRARILETRTGPGAALAVLMPVIALVALYATLSLFDLWYRLPPLLHLLIFICLVVVVLGGLVAAVGAFRRHRQSDGIRWSRYALLLPVLTIALFVAGPDWERRMVMALKPGLLFPPPAMQITAVITPPDYTGLAAINLPVRGDHGATPLRVPAGSVLRIETQATRWPPRLTWGREAVLLRPQSDGSYAIDGELKADGRVNLTYAGRTLVRWGIDVVPDQPPSVRLASPPQATARHNLRLDIEAADDHGIVFLGLRLKRADGSGVDHVVDLPAWGGRSVRESFYRDLTGDPLAGQDVVLQVLALDALGQETLSAPLTLTLPRRNFRNPLSLSLAAIRAGLLTGEEDDVAQAVRRLRLLSERPLNTADATVHLGLRSAYQRLKSSYTEEERQEVADLLWDLVRRAEDGGRGLSEAELAEALDNLLLMLHREAAPEQVQGALAATVEAFDNYGRNREGQENPLLGDRDAIDWQALDRLFQRLNDLALAGDYATLAEQVRSLRSGLEERPALMLSASAYRNFMVASYARRVLDEVTRQQELLTARARGDAVRPMALASDQAALRDAMSDLVTQLIRAGMGDVGPFVKARMAMETAVSALANGAEAGISESQQRVSEALAEATDRLKAVPSPMMTDPSGRYRDPLGRPLPPELEGSGVETPIP